MPWIVQPLLIQISVHGEIDTTNFIKRTPQRFITYRKEHRKFQDNFFS